MIQINSELPNQLLNRNLMLNDYDFVLFHLFETSEKYRKYYLNLRATRPERKMILDNSAYEFFVKGLELDTRIYVDAIRLLDPDYYILPDVLMDKDKTLEGVNKFIDEYNNVLDCFSGWGSPIAVLQGNSADELMECAEVYDEMGLSCIAIPFHNSFFKDLGKSNEYDAHVHVPSHRCLVESFAHMYNISTYDITDDMWYAIGRIKFIHNYYYILSQFDYIHLLGSHCPYEKNFYKTLEYIKSMDTGYPVKCAMEGHELFKEPHKPNIILDDFIDKPITLHKQLIMNNVLKFKNL